MSMWLTQRGARFNGCPLALSARDVSCTDIRGRSTLGELTCRDSRVHSVPENTRPVRVVVTAT